MAKTGAVTRKKNVPQVAFTDRQLSLFQAFLTNELENDSLSNAIDLWDSVPRYSISRPKQNEMRSPEGTLPTMALEFSYRGKDYRVKIRPARLDLKGEDNRPLKDEKGNPKSIEYYPSAREEVVEHALRRIAAETNAGFYDKTDKSSGVAFTLHRLRQELADSGHSMTYENIVESLEILHYSSIAITDADLDATTEGDFSQSYFPTFARVNKKTRAADPEAKWFVQFHSFVAYSIDKIAYRQFNYRRLMKCKTQLARWLLSQLVIKFTQASLATTFEMRYSTIRRDSNLLTGYRRTRDAIAALDEAWDHLRELGALYFANKAEETGARGKVIDAIYTLTPSREFIAEQKAANKRAADARKAAERMRLGQAV
jgi:hypothetical protein